MRMAETSNACSASILQAFASRDRPDIRITMRGSTRFIERAMSLLIAGLVVFLVSHSVGIVAPDWRARQVERLGERPWKLLYSAVSLAALVMIVWGYGAARAAPTLLWMPPAWTRHVTALLAVVGFVLIAAAY